MGKLDFRKLSKNDLLDLEDELWKTLKGMRALKKDPSLLFRDLLTMSEVVMLARRIQIAKLLMCGQSQQDICLKLSVGLSTVQSIDRWLREKFEDYRDVLPELYKQTCTLQQSKDRKRVPIDLYSFRWLRRKYPLHSLLFNAILDDLRFGPPPTHPAKGKYKPKYLSPKQYKTSHTSIN
ncbi:hypothetical protein HYZ98_01145 [Candidatus Peregrinibacteria bacterium]|nr:hypothetical protein [Candidatus Peregrinibacteria bacterium]